MSKPYFVSRKKASIDALRDRMTVETASRHDEYAKREREERAAEEFCADKQSRWSALLTMDERRKGGGAP